MSIANQIFVPAGQIEVICGCMFSGKTALLLSRSDVANRLGLPVRVFKHALDDRYGRGRIVTHTGQAMPAFTVAGSADIPIQLGPAEVVLIDEAQFFDPRLPKVCQTLAHQGKRVVVAGLDRDSWGEPFGPMPVLQQIAQRVTRTTAICAQCGGPAEYTQRLTPVEGRTMIGGAGSYEPRCSRCFQPPPAHLRR